MGLLTGTYHNLKVERDSPFGYFLSDGYEDVLLHFSELDDKEVVIGEMIEAFLYNDHKGRPAATLVPPKLILGDVEFLEVKDYKPTMGFFLENTISKQVLLPLAELPEDKNIWPINGDQLLVKLVHDKQERLLAALARDESELELFLAKRPVVELPESKKDFSDAIVLKNFTSGSHIYLTEYNIIGFLHQTERLHELRIGETVKVRLSYVREDGKVNFSMKPLREISRIEDSDMILKILQERGGSMPYWDKTPPDIIMQKFNLSKAAFKRALGKLMKDGIVYQENGWTYIKND